MSSSGSPSKGAMATEDDVSDGELISDASSEASDCGGDSGEAEAGDSGVHSASCGRHSQLILSRQRKAEPKLPPNTVTVLSLPDISLSRVPNLPGEAGLEVEMSEEERESLREAEELVRAGRVYLVGTAHFSRESQRDVEAVVGETEPDLVMVELCRSRLNVLELDEERLLKEASELGIDKILAQIKAAGLVQGVMYVLLVSMSANITRQLGMAPGGEFRAGLRAARQVTGCQMDLGDRPVEITLQRAIGSLSWWKKLRLFAYILVSHSATISPEDVEKCKEKVVRTDRFGTYFIYLTNWTFILLTIFNCFALAVAIKAKGDQHGKETPLLYRIFWALNSVTANVSIIVVVVYWALLYDPDVAKVTALNLHYHGMNGVFALVDIFVSATPWRFGHVWVPMVYGLVYGAFSGIYHAAGGKNAEGQPYIYPILNYGDEPGKATGTILGVAFVALPILHLGLVGLSRLSDAIGRRCQCAGRTQAVHPADVELEA